MSEHSRSPAPSDRVGRGSGSGPRVLFLINDLRLGGAERSFVNRVNHLRAVQPLTVLIDPAAGSLLGDLRSDLPVFSLHHSAPTPIPLTELRDMAAVASRRPRGRLRGQLLLESPKLLLRAYRLARLAHATNTHVVSTFLNRSHTIALLAKLLFAPRLRVVINVQEVLSESLQWHFAFVERAFMRAFIHRAFPLADQIIAVSDGVLQDLVRHFGMADSRIAVVPSPLDIARIRALSAEHVDDVGIGRRPLSIVAVGRLVRLKGFDLLIRALARLPATLPARLIIIGEGEERAALQRLAAELDVTDRLTLPGARDNPWKYMARAAVVAVPSRTEAFPNIVGEALALSVPVVAARCSEGVAEYLEGGRSGVLVPPDDVDALAAALERVLTDQDLRAQLIQNGAARARTFDLSEIVPRYERLIEQVARQ